MIAFVWGADAAYWATPARIGEILMGSFLAVVLARRSMPASASPVAPVAFAVLAVCIVAFPSSGGPAYGGALPLVAIVSAGLIVGLQVPGRLRRVFETEFFVWVGSVSYGLYLFHWPIFLIIHPDRLSWPGPLIFVARIAVTLVVTVASYELLEQPIRTAGGLRPKVTFTTAGISTAVVVAVAVVAVPASLGDYWNPDDDVVEAVAIEVTDTPLAGLAAAPTADALPPVVTSSVIPAAPIDDAPIGTGDGDAAPVPSSSPSTASTTPPTSDPGPEPEPEPLPPLTRPVRIVVTGDSTAEALGTGLVQWAAAHPDLAQVDVVSAPGCGFLLGGERRTGDTVAPIEGCDRWINEFVYPTIERAEPDVVVSMVSSWDIIDRRWETDELLTPFDAPYASRLDTDYEQFVTDVFDRGATRFAFVRHPIQDVYWLPAADAQEDPARHDVLYGVYDRLAGVEERVDVVALDRWFSERGLDRSEEARPDGIHLAPEASARISEEFLGEALIRVALGVYEP